MPDYRIEYTIFRRLDGEEDFTEIGFGQSGEWSSTDEAVHIVNSDVQSGCWETEAGMPDPAEVSRG